MRNVPQLEFEEVEINSPEKLKLGDRIGNLRLCYYDHVFDTYVFDFIVHVKNESVSIENDMVELKRLEVLRMLVNAKVMRKVKD